MTGRAGVATDLGALVEDYGMEIGVLGLPLSGKTTLFSLLTGVAVPAGSHRTEAARGVADIRDPRVGELSTIFHPKKTTYAAVTFVDLPSYDLASGRKEKNRVLQFIQNSDALLLVVRAFDDEAVPWPAGHETPARQLEALRAELLLRDMEVLEARMTNLQEGGRRRKLTVDEEAERVALELIGPVLEEERPVSSAGLTPEQRRAVGSCGFFTAKPIMVAVNVDDEQLVAGAYPEMDEVAAICRANGMALLTLSGKIESEIAALPEEDAREFMADLGLAERGIDRLARLAYQHIGLISFLTVGEDEVRAWTIGRNTTARGAAGKIHTDLEKHFIRAEVVPYDIFMQYRALLEARSRGQIRSVGREEIIQDGDIVNILANA